MSPALLTPPQSTWDLVNAGIKPTIEYSAPSITSNGFSTLQELDASKLIFTRNLNPRPLPEPDSPEVWAANVYVPFLCLALHLDNTLTLTLQMHRPHDNRLLDVHNRLGRP